MTRKKKYLDDVLSRGEGENAKFIKRGSTENVGIQKGMILNQTDMNSNII